MRLAFAAALLTTSALAACDGPGTASGRPDTTLRDVDRACVSSQFINGALSQGWQVRQSNESQIVLARQSTSPVTAALLGSGFGVPEQRLVVTMVPGVSPSGGRELRLVVDSAVVTNPATAYERTTPARYTAADQAAFEAMGRRAESACAAR